MSLPLLVHFGFWYSYLYSVLLRSKLNDNAFSLCVTRKDTTLERDTSQRRAIRRVFREIGRPLSPQEVLEHGREHAPNLGIATVYRSVKGFMEEGWLVPVEVPGEPQRYELSGMDHHHHFSCRTCGRIFDFDGCPSNLGGLVPPGFEMDDHEIYIYGRCAECTGVKV